VPALGKETRIALQCSVKNANVAGVVSTGKIVKKSGLSASSTDNHAETQRVARSQAIEPLESAIFYKEHRHVGLPGESATYRLLKNILEEKVQRENWTSKLRQCAGPFSAWQAPPGEEEDSSDDFTYFDEDQTSLKGLVSNGIDIAKVWQTKLLKFYIEVKSTATSCAEVFHLSRLQTRKAERLTAPTDGCAPEDVLLTFRVYELSADRDGQPSVQIYIDPRQLFEEGVLQCHTEGWLVGPA
jgi:hypothetical protein